MATDNQRIWSRARDELIAEVTALGFPAELAELMARQLQSPKAIERMASYVRQAKPRSARSTATRRAWISRRASCWMRLSELSPT